MIEKSNYTSPPLLFNKHLQTILPAVFRKVKGVDYQRERITIPDGDFLDLDWLRNHNDKLVIISHGLEGNSKRSHVLGMAKAFFANGFDIVAWNYRGCSEEINHCLRFYHSGATDDLGLIIQHALQHQQYQTIHLIGFSLGGNITLKYLGEQSKKIHPRIKKAVTFSVPMNLHSSCIQISKIYNYPYAFRFLKSLKNKVRTKARLMPGKLEVKGLDKIKTLYQFDDAYTAPLHGFKNALHYYQSCSSINFLADIKIPTLIVNALNDPFLASDCYPRDIDNKYLTIEYPREGGHCGFYSNNSHGVYWSESRALKFIKNQ
ncbi:MAG: alpha/beta fold hydrolase [Bacteroidetes bacterium]|nr:alpha/beta fold hydrolase [Bacteroidota bacterium]